TFHAKYWFFRVPLDLLFHSPSVFIDRLFIYPSVGSDHFPIGCTFHVDRISEEQQEEIEELKQGEMTEVNELIQEGKEEESDNHDYKSSPEQTRTAIKYLRNIYAIRRTAGPFDDLVFPTKRLQCPL